MLRPLTPAPLGARFRAELTPAPNDRPLTKTVLDEKLRPYVSDISFGRLGAHYGPTPVDNGGSAALQALVDVAWQHDPTSLKDCKEYLDEAFVRGLAHLRNVGIAHTVRRGQGLAILSPDGDHPYVAVIADYARRNVDVAFWPKETEGKIGAGVMMSQPRQLLLLDARALLALDPTATLLVHEDVHVDHPKHVGATPHAGEATAVQGTLPGQAHWEYSDYQHNEESLAYGEQLRHELVQMYAALSRGEPIDEGLGNAEYAATSGLQATLRSIAIAKQALGAIERRSLKRTAGAIDDLQSNSATFRVTTRRRAYDIKLESRWLLPISTAVDSLFSKPGELGAMTRGRLHRHFAWQLRAHLEKLAIFRVAAQALERMREEPDKRILGAAMAVLGAARTVGNEHAAGLTYDEALRLFNDVLERPLLL